MKKEQGKAVQLKTKKTLPSPEDLNAMRRRLRNLTVHYMSVSKKQICSEESK
jgi:ribosomal protein S15P/S13E